jgi:glycosyltransferase involved in cell wall biosynthesis
MGGAEVQLVRLASRLDRRTFEPTVLCFYDKGPLIDDLRSAHVPVVFLNKKGRYDLVAFWFGLVAKVRSIRPRVVHSFMGPPNILAVLLKLVLPGLRVVWGVRSSNMDLGRYDYSWRLTFLLERWLSRWADSIVANSHSGSAYIGSRGFAGDRIVVVANGIDFDELPDRARARSSFRRELGAADHVLLIGIVARQDPMKGYDVFLKAAALVAKERVDVRFVCIGERGLLDSESLEQFAQTLGIEDRVVWLGFRSDVLNIMAGLDVCTSASLYGEGFSNVVLESLAVGTPCVVTDVGDSARIVDDPELIARPGDAASLAAAWRNLIALDSGERQRRAARAQDRVRQLYGLDRMVAQMATIYRGEGSWQPAR